ncbi:hypothetical protein CTI12_AA158560 [Artemisia annua]|uniref:Uncharacterized protein n=1 Tax=Artemisia annua TaxID=35608 RepID=A0A2U1PDS0_ARTAN|nr:hypothetical protein CTI12_AA158560 [Artemisia annua]
MDCSQSEKTDEQQQANDSSMQIVAHQGEEAADKDGLKAEEANEKNDEQQQDQKLQTNESTDVKRPNNLMKIKEIKRPSSMQIVAHIA